VSQTHPERSSTAHLPGNSAILILIKQHARIKDMFAAVKRSSGAGKRELFDDLRELLAIHEAGEEMVLRPVSRTTAGTELIDELNHEESQAALLLAALEQLDPAEPRFDPYLTRLESAVAAHVQREEDLEFPTILAACSEEDQVIMAKRLAAVQQLAPTHPHPLIAGSTAAQYVVGPFVSLVDHARDMYSGRDTGSGK
jgi:iron-sulfur cluster repair protein YtfE (RIC family)